MLSSVSNYQNLHSASLFFRLNNCTYTTEISCPRRDMPNESLGTMQRTQNTRNKKSIHKNSTQREEKQFTMKAVHPTAEHTTRNQSFTSRPTFVSFHAPHYQKNTLYANAARKRRSEQKTKAVKQRRVGYPTATMYRYRKNEVDGTGKNLVVEMATDVRF